MNIQEWTLYSRQRGTTRQRATRLERNSVRSGMRMLVEVVKKFHPYISVRRIINIFKNMGIDTKIKCVQKT